MKNISQKPAPTSFQEVLGRITAELGEHNALLSEVAASNAMTLLLADPTFCESMILEGPSGTGKSTIISLLSGFDQAYRTDSFTPAALVVPGKVL